MGIAVCYNSEMEKDAGDTMDDKIDVLDIALDNISVKDVLKKMVEFCATEPISIIENFTSDTILSLEENAELKEAVTRFDLNIPGDKGVLEAAGVSDRRLLEDTERGQFVKALLKYLHKYKYRAFLLADSEAEGRRFYQGLSERYRDIQLIGMAQVSGEHRADDMLVNAINGGEIDCIISLMSTPLQEDFIVKNKNLLNARVWLGIGSDFLKHVETGPRRERIFQFLKKKLLKNEIKKRQNML